MEIRSALDSCVCCCVTRRTESQLFPCDWRLGQQHGGAVDVFPHTIHRVLSAPLPGKDLPFLDSVRTHTHTHARTYAHALTDAHAHARTHAHTHARTHARIHTHTHTHTHIHTHARTKHTYTHARTKHTDETERDKRETTRRQT